MRAIEARLGSEIASDKIAAVKAPESGGLMDAFKTAVSFKAVLRNALEEKIDALLSAEARERIAFDPIFAHRAARLTERVGDDSIRFDS
jgi:hypothetical protein